MLSQVSRTAHKLISEYLSSKGGYHVCEKQMLFLVITTSLISLAIACGGIGSPPKEVEQTIRNIYSSPGGGKFGWEIENVSNIEITGEGKTLPDEKNVGVEEIYCVNVEIDARDDTAGRFLGFSYLVGRIGNSWEATYVYEDGWNQHSCPGKYNGQ